MYGIWVTDHDLEEGGEWFVSHERKIWLFETQAKAQIVCDALDYDMERPMRVMLTHLPGEIYKGKLLDDPL